MCEEFRKTGKTIVQCHGCFDLLHPGHFKHFEAAKKFGDILVISITADKYVDKGPDRPVFNEMVRAETLSSIEAIDYVTINHAPTAVPAIEIIKPDFYVKGQDYKDASKDITGGILKEKETVEQFNGKLVFTNEIRFSSSKLINRHIIEVNDTVKDYLKTIRSKYSHEDLKKRFEEIANYSVLVIGDIILDEYQFVNPMEIGRAHV